jgi:hypothetical protein
MAVRRKNNLSPEQKAQRAAASAEQKDQNQAIDWGARHPQTKEARDELFIELRAKEAKLKDETASLQLDVKGQKKRMNQTFGYHKLVIDFDKRMMNLSAGERARVWRQLQLRAADAIYDAQPDLFDMAAVGQVAEDTGSPFDNSAAGERQDAERKDDPARANKHATAAAPPAAPSPGMPLDEAQQKLEEAKAAADAKKPKGRGKAKLTVVSDTKPEADKSFTEQLREQNKQTEQEIKTGTLGANPPPAPPADDEGLDIPGFLRRGAHVEDKGPPLGEGADEGEGTYDVVNA